MSKGVAPAGSQLDSPRDANLDSAQVPSSGRGRGKVCRERLLVRAAVGSSVLFLMLEWTIMCGILFTTKNLSQVNMRHVLEFLEKRGPDRTTMKIVRHCTFIHTLLSMTGPLTEQPFYSGDSSVVCMFNGEIYNFEEFGPYQSDGECLVPLYEKYGLDFLDKLDGEFAVVLVDFSKSMLIYSTDIFGTRPLWVAFDGSNFGVSTYRSCLERCGLSSSFQVLANRTCVLDLNTMRLAEQQRVHTFDLTQHKSHFNDWNKAFADSIRKRTRYAKCGIFIGMSGGYDSGAIACELTKQGLDFSAYSVANVEDRETMEERAKIVRKARIIELEREDFLAARAFLKQNAEEYFLNFDNGEKDRYNALIQQESYSRAEAGSLLRMIEFRKRGQTVTDDNGAVGCSYVCSLAKQNDEKIYLSGSGADEIFSDYGFNGVKYFGHSTIGGHFPSDLETVFPWKNFFGNAQRAYLMKEEHVAGAHGIEGRYPFLDKRVVQEFLWLRADLKNRAYKAPLDNFLTVNKFPYDRNQKTGFGCGFAGPDPSGIEFRTLSEEEKRASRNRRVTDVEPSRVVDFEQLVLKPTRSSENFCSIEASAIRHEMGNGYYASVEISHPGLKHCANSRFTLLEDDVPLPYPVVDHSSIRQEGEGRYCFWTTNALYFSSSDNSDPRTNGRKYAITKLHSNLRQLSYENARGCNAHQYYICIAIKTCSCGIPEYFRIRNILNHYNFVPNVVACDDREIFMDLPNVRFCPFDKARSYASRVATEDVMSITVDTVRHTLFDHSSYDDNYVINKGSNPIVTIFIFTIGNHQFKYALESALSQNASCRIAIIRDKLPADALNAMLDRTTTDYAIQMDEDMVFFSRGGASEMVKTLQGQTSNTWQYCYSLRDRNFGVGPKHQLLGIKIFNIQMMRKHKLRYSQGKSFAVDRIVQTRAKELNLKNEWTASQIGHHQKHFDPYDLFLRCAKMGHELCNPIQGWGWYELGMFMKYITTFEYDELIQTIHYIVSRFGGTATTFFDKMRLVHPDERVEAELHDSNQYQINVPRYQFIHDLKSGRNVLPPRAGFYPRLCTNFYCLMGFLYPFYFDFEYSPNKTLGRWFEGLLGPRVRVVVSSTQHPGYGGSATNAYELIKHFRQAGHITAGVFFPSSVSVDCDPGKIGGVFSYSRRAIELGCGPARVVRDVTGYLGGHPDVCFAKNYWTPAMCKRIFNCRTVYLVSGVNHFAKCNGVTAQAFLSGKVSMNVSIPSEIESNKAADLIVLNSKLSLEVFRKVYPSFKAKMRPVPIDTSQPLTPVSVPAVKKYDIILACSRLDRADKNNMFLIDVLKRPAFDSYKKVFVGSNHRSFLSIPNSECTGLLGHSECVEKLSESRILLFPSWFDANPNTVREALAHRCLPLISNNTGCYEKYPKELVCESFDEHEWTEKLLHLLDNYENLKETRIEFDNNIHDLFTVARCHAARAGSCIGV